MLMHRMWMRAVHYKKGLLPVHSSLAVTASTMIDMIEKPRAEYISFWFVGSIIVTI